MTGSLPRQSLQTNDADRARLWTGCIVAVGLHALIAFGLPKAIVTPAEFSMQAPAENVEVELIEAHQEESTPPEPPTPPMPPQIAAPETPPPAPMPAPVLKETAPDPPLTPPPLPKEETLAKIEEQPAPPPEPTPAPPPPLPVAKPAPPKPVRTISTPESGATSNKSPSSTNQTGAAGDTSKPSVLYNPPPIYPSESTRANEEGSVLLSVQVNASGRADTVTISKSSGFQRLDRSASEAVRRWKFKPATRNGKPIATIVDVPFVFRLKQ
jgi:protein TonB